MATQTAKMGLTIPLGGDKASRLGLVTAIQQLELAAGQDHAWLKSVSYDAGNNRIVAVLGPMQADFLSTRVSIAADSTYYISTPATNTSYTLYLKSDGTFTHNTTGAEVAGQVPLWRITTGSVLTTLTAVDLRGGIHGAGIRAIKELLDAHSGAAQTHGAGTGLKLATTSRTDQKPTYNDLQDLPATFAPSAHKNSHATGGTDAMTPGDIGAVAKGGDTMTGALTLAGDPTNALHATPKQYVDAVAQGLDPKASVKAATTANIALSGLQTIDGVSLSVGDRVLVKDQTTASQNGIYVVASGLWSRATDADTSAKVTSGMFTFVEQGTLYGGTGWNLITAGTITLGTTALTFSQFSGAGQIVNGAGLLKSGNQLSVDFLTTGGTNGSASQAARSDHTHTTASIGAETPSGAQAKADAAQAAATEEGLVIEKGRPVAGEEPTQVESSMGLAIEFADGVTQSIKFNRRWPFTGNLKMELVAAMDTSFAGNVRVQVSYQVNGGAATNVAITVTALASTTNLVTVDLGQIIAAGSVPQGGLVAFKLSRLGADAADTHTGKLRIYHTRLTKG